MSEPFKVVRDFEAALCDYTGARYAVTTTSCTMALLLVVAWHLAFRRPMANDLRGRPDTMRTSNEVQIPKRTYVGVAQSILNAGGQPTFRDERWSGAYQLRPLPVWDAARLFTSGMFLGVNPGTVAPFQNSAGQMVCVSFHHTKILGLAAHGGAILHDSEEADEWLRRARFDGRKEGVHPKDDTFTRGFHCYMTPPTAAEGLMRLATLPNHNEPLPWGPGTNSDYSDLSTCELFR